MTARGVDFLEKWIQKNVRAGGPPDDPLTATVLATRCIAEAAAEGFTLEDIKPDTGAWKAISLMPWSIPPIQERPAIETTSIQCGGTARLVGDHWHCGRRHLARVLWVAVVIASSNSNLPVRFSNDFPR